jgi:putative sterol carrier protein
LLAKNHGHGVRQVAGALSNAAADALNLDLVSAMSPQTWLLVFKGDANTIAEDPALKKE